MKTLIISDIHDNLVNLTKCLNWAKNNGFQKIICCGDVTNQETIGFLSQSFVGEIFLIRGNMELYDDALFPAHKNINYLGRFGEGLVDGKKFGLCHEPDFFFDVLKLDPTLQLIFYGHTHKPWLEDKKGILYINPGTLGGVFQKATFATWDTETNNIELKILENL